MAIYHCSIKIIGRSDGKSAIAAAAYRAGEKLKSEEENTTYDFTRKNGIRESGILLPPNAPQDFNDREKLWNAVQTIEKTAKAQLAREIEVALPAELSADEQHKLLIDFINQQFVKKGMCADWAIHDKQDGNPHAHIMLTTRKLSKNGKWEKKENKGYALDKNGDKIPLRNKDGTPKTDKRGYPVYKRESKKANDWNDRNNAEIWRKAWANAVNDRLPPTAEKIDWRSYERQGTNKIPTKHIGKGQGAKARKKYNETVKTLNNIRAELYALENDIKEYDNATAAVEKIRQIHKKESDAYYYQRLSEMNEQEKTVTEKINKASAAYFNKYQAGQSDEYYAIQREKEVLAKKDRWWKPIKPTLSDDERKQIRQDITQERTTLAKPLDDAIADRNKIRDNRNSIKRSDYSYTAKGKALNNNLIDAIDRLANIEKKIIPPAILHPSTENKERKEWQDMSRDEKAEALLKEQDKYI